MYQPEDGAPYRPSNGTEGDSFEARWCQRCAREDVDAGDLCDIHGNALFGEQPDEWVYESGQPVCKAFIPFNGMQPLPEPRCDKTMDIFAVAASAGEVE